MSVFLTVPSQVHPSIHSLTIRRLTINDASEISELLRAQSSDYMKYFKPFDFDIDSIRSELARCRQDFFSGYFASGGLIGFFMLRGYDEGFNTPFIGVFISEEFRDCGLLGRSIEECRNVAKLLGSPCIYYKSHRENVPCRKAHLFGFTEIGVHASGHKIFRLAL